MVVLTRDVAVGIKKSGLIFNLEVDWWLNIRVVRERGVKADSGLGVLVVMMMSEYWESSTFGGELRNHQNSVNEKV